VNTLLKGGNKASACCSFDHQSVQVPEAQRGSGLTWKEKSASGRDRVTRGKMQICTERNA
jgi:hypothetical protein